MKPYLDRPIEELCAFEETSLKAVIEILQGGEKQIALVVDEGRKLLGVITDGDVRRAILRNVSLEAPASEIMQRNFTVRRQDITDQEVFDLMRLKSIRHVPLVDDHDRLVDLVWITDLIRGIRGYMKNVQAMVMAGGFGHRLRPLTEEVPKPMLKIGEKPLLEIIIGQLKEVGINRVILSTHYKGEVISNHFRNGEDFGININYISEEQPMGTAGVLGLLENTNRPVLLINGDILTRVDFDAMYRYHVEHRADITVAAHHYEIEVPYGVIECKGSDISCVKEKPRLRFFVNAGIYLLQPTVHRYIEKGRPLNMPDLIERLIAAGLAVKSFPIIEYWLDIGQHSDYDKAQEDVLNGKLERKR